MSQHDLHRHLTPAVGEAQQTAYGQKTYAVPDAPEPDRLGARERAFISARDSFYLASVTETGAPYIQHRGGPLGFLRLLDERTLAFVDYGGKRQLLTTGHRRSDPRAALFQPRWAIPRSAPRRDRAGGMNGLWPGFRARRTTRSPGLPRCRAAPPGSPSPASR